MFLKSLTVKNFRNFDKLNFNFSTPITILVGDNAQGKSNFLESIYFLATAKSHKADQDDEVIKLGSESVYIEGLVTQRQESGKTKLEVALQDLSGNIKKQAKINGIPRRVIDYCLNLAVVLFSPEDLNLISGTPNLRRGHIDGMIGQVSQRYKKAVSDYEAIVIRKNRLLKAIRDGIAGVDQLDYWYDQQILLSGKISNQRQYFFDFINKQQKKFGDYSYQYLESKISKDDLIKHQDREIESTISLIGPHRDDFAFLLNGTDLAKFGSRGEQRTAVLDLKIAEVGFMTEILGERPVLLLDDIFSELDQLHKKHVIDIASLQQTIITTIEFEESLKAMFKQTSFFSVENGHVTGIADK